MKRRLHKRRHAGKVIYGVEFDIAPILAASKDALWEYERLECHTMRDALEFERPLEIARIDAELSKESAHVRQVLEENFDIPALMRLYEVPPSKCPPQRITLAARRRINLAGDLWFEGLGEPLRPALHAMSAYLFPDLQSGIAKKKTRKLWKEQGSKIKARLNLRKRLR